MCLERSINRLKTGGKLAIVALGDSLTYGWMVRKGYLDYLAEMLSEKYPNGNFSIINKGIPGDTAQGGLYRLKQDVIDEDPDLVFIQFGLNDAFSGVSPGSFKKSVLSLTDTVREATHAEILLLTSVPIFNEREDSIAELFCRELGAVSEEKGIPIAQVSRYWKKRLSEGIDFKKLVQYDQVHPTAEGYRLMAEAIMEMF
jgi:acyl-CoA thioesterase I